MLKRYAYILTLLLIGFLTLSSVPHETTYLEIEGVTKPKTKVKPLRLKVRPQDRSDEYVLIKGIMTSKVKEGRWYQCGEVVPREDWYNKAVEIAEACVYTARPLGVDPVGQLATWQQESRLDPCALGKHPREWAVREGLLKAKKNTLSYTKQEVKKVLGNPKFKASFPVVDVGLAQLLYPRYTRGADIDEMLSISGAIYSAKELEYRGKRWRTEEPWITWPGHKSQARKNTINWWVYRVMEIDFLK